MTKRITIVCFYLAILTHVSTKAGEPSLLAYETLYHLDTSSLSQEKSSIPNNDIRHFDLEAFGQQFALILSPNYRITRGLQTPATLHLFKGTLANQPNSWVRLAVEDGKTQGLIWSGSELYTIQYLSDTDNHLAPVANEHIIYRLSDIYIEPGSMSCGTQATTALQSYKHLVSELKQRLAKTAEASQEITLSAVGDFPFVQNFGSNSESALLTRFNAVDGIFSEQLGIQITVANVTLEGQNDATFSTSEAGDLLDELSDFRNNNANLRNTGLTHLYTGRDLNGSTVGIAFLGALCSNRFGAGLSMGGISLTTDTLVAAHEIGHNFGAPHDGETGSPCQNTVGAFLMSPNVNGNDNFSQCSLDQIQPEIAGASCLAPLAAVDVTVIAQNGVSALFGEPFNFVFNVNNNGTGTANNVSFDVTIPNQLATLSVTPSSGTCTQAAGGYTCGLGAISSGSTSSVVLNIRGDAAGTFSMPATVNADGDNSAPNNNITASVDIQPVVDLGLSFATNSDTFPVNTSGVVNLSLSNSGQTAAQDISITLEAPTAYNLTDASLANGSCDVAPKLTTCSLTTLASNASVQIAITVSGSSTDNGILRTSVSSASADTNTQNDVALHSVAFQAQTGGNGTPGGSSGGGTQSFFILGLLTICLRQRRNLWSR